jgi:hypothetical protein
VAPGETLGSPWIPLAIRAWRTTAKAIFYPFEHPTLYTFAFSDFDSIESHHCFHANESDIVSLARLGHPLLALVDQGALLSRKGTFFELVVVLKVNSMIRRTLNG